MTKRKKFILTAGILSAMFFLIQVSNILFRYEAIIVVILVSLVLSFWALRDTLARNTTLLTLILPVAFTAGIGFFYFLLPGTLFARIPVVVLYGLGMYALLLTANIYNVAAIRTIALLRAAHAVGFLLTLVTSFFLFDTLWSFRGFPWINGPGSALLSFPLILQSLWSVELDERIKRTILETAIVISVVIGEIGFILSLWPITVVVTSLFLTSMLYILIGLSHALIAGRLFTKTVKEYLFVGLVVFLAVLISAKWGG
ncbi:hypothetical protein HY405_00615 [Candidatus Microgenomates bacterium]|nr:hypothetical protein [Candidatus Microgenomates bacterium]